MSNEKQKISQQNKNTRSPAQKLPVRLSKNTKDKLVKAGVGVIYLFGSRASADYLDFSDIDVGIVMEDLSLLYDDPAKTHNTIYDIISTDIPDQPDGIKLDMSFLQKSNPSLTMKAIQEGYILFESSARLRVDFEEYTFHRYNDYLKLQREFNEATMQAFG